MEFWMVFVSEAITNLLLFWSIHWYFVWGSFEMSTFRNKLNHSTYYMKYRIFHVNIFEWNVRVCSNSFFPTQISFYSMFFSSFCLNFETELDPWQKQPNCNVIDIVWTKVLIKVGWTDQIYQMNTWQTSYMKLVIIENKWQIVQFFQLHERKKTIDCTVELQLNTNHDTQMRVRWKSLVNYKALHFNSSLLFSHSSIKRLRYLTSRINKKDSRTNKQVLWSTWNTPIKRFSSPAFDTRQ